MKKIISMFLLLTIVFSCFVPQISFANDYVITKYSINGETFTVKESYIEGNKVVTVENNDSIFKSTYNKDGNIIITEIDKNKVSRYSSAQEQFVTEIKLPKESNLISPLSNYHIYQSKYFPDYKYTSIRATTTGRIFDLSIPTDSLRTPTVYSGDKIDDLSSDFYYTLMDSDDYTKSAIMAGFGFIPGVGDVISIATIIENLSQSKKTLSSYAAAFIAAIEMTPGLGAIVNMADFASNAALSMTELYNVRTIFRNIKSRI